MAARSVNCTLVNSTGETLTLTSKTIDHGIFSPGQEPPQTAGDSGAAWSSESSGFMTGTEGTAAYSGASGGVSVHWDNPFVGGNSFDASASGDYRMVRVDGPKTGSNVGVVYRVERKTKPAPPTPPPAPEPEPEPAAEAPAEPAPEPEPEDHRNDAHVPIVGGTPATLSVKRWLVDVAWEAVNHMEWSEQILEITENRHGEQSGGLCPGTLPKWPDVARSGMCKQNHPALRAARKKDHEAKVQKYIDAGKDKTEAEKLAVKKRLTNDYHSWCGDYVTWVFWKAWVLKGKPEDKITKAKLAEFLNREALSGAWKKGENLNMVERFAKKEGNGYLAWHPLGDGYVPQPGDIYMANRDDGGHIGIVGFFDANPLYRRWDKEKKRPYYAFVTLNGKSFDEGYIIGKKEPTHDAAGWNQDVGWLEEIKNKWIKKGAQGAPSIGAQGVAQVHHTTADMGEGEYKDSLYVRAFIDTSKLREALGYR